MMLLIAGHYSTSLGPGSALGGKGEKNRRGQKKKLASEASQEVVWGGERVVEPGDIPLMWQIHPPAINLSLKSSTHQVLITDVSVSLLCCSNLWKIQYLNSRWSKSASKEIYLTLINWSNNSFGEEKKRVWRKKHRTTGEDWTAKQILMEDPSRSQLVS